MAGRTGDGGDRERPPLSAMGPERPGDANCAAGRTGPLPDTAVPLLYAWPGG